MSVTDKKAFKNKICDIIDGRTEDITAIGDTIRKNPELGYKEFRTADLSAHIMKSAGLTVESGLAVTGLKGRLVGKHHGPTIALIGEMDALPAPDHPWADPETGVSHNCGHDAQIAGLLGAVFGLTAAGIAPAISGTIIFFCVPAEEYVDIDFRERLAKEGVIAYLGGKQELIRLGQFDDVDLSLMIHVHSSADYPTVAVAESSNGHRSRRLRESNIPRFSIAGLKSIHTTSPNDDCNLIKSNRLIFFRMGRWTRPPDSIIDRLFRELFVQELVKVSSNRNVHHGDGTRFQFSFQILYFFAYCAWNGLVRFQKTDGVVIHGNPMLLAKRTVLPTLDDLVVDNRHIPQNGTQ